MKLFTKFISILIVLTVGFLTACDNTKPKVEDTSGSTAQTTSEAAEESLLYFNDDEGSAKLIRCFEEGNVPEEATILYDQMGSNPEITITEPEKIRELYQLLRSVTVIGETNESITDCYHYIQFKLAEDCYVRFSFEGSEIWCYEKQNYSIGNSQKLFTFMNELTNEYLNQEG